MTMWLFQDALVTGEYSVSALFGGFHSVAGFNIMSLVSPVSWHPVSSETHFEKPAAHAHEPQGKKKSERDSETVREGD